MLYLTEVPIFLTMTVSTYLLHTRYRPVFVYLYSVFWFVLQRSGGVPVSCLV